MIFRTDTPPAPGEYNAGMEMPVPESLRYWFDGKFWSEPYHAHWPRGLKEKSKAARSPFQFRYWRPIE